METISSTLSNCWRKALNRKRSEPIKIGQDSNNPIPSPFSTKAHGIEKMGLCQACEMLDIYSMPSEEPVTHLSTMFALLETAKYCRLCAMVAAYLLRRRRPSRLKTAIGDDLFPSMNIPLLVQLQGNDLLRFSGFQYGPIEVQAFFMHDAVPSPTDPLAGSDHAINEALLANAPSCCISSHDGQVSMSTEDPLPPLPRRIIDLAAFGEPAKVQLRVTTNLERGRYTTVSHRWGGDIPFKTTRRNLRSYTKCINVTQLPQNFQDAIQVTRMLGIRYIWIDALCIVQNDRADWREQAGQMGTIYENSTIMLALHSPLTSTDGFLWRMKVPKWLEVSTDAARRNKSSPFWLEIPSLDDRAMYTAMGSSSIIRRAWCLQELRLASRILHIVEDKFLWDCPHSQSHLDGYDIFAGKSKAESTRNSGEDWFELIEGYSSCALTVSTDKLLAIAGVHSRWPDPCRAGSHCGLLGVDVHNGLLWHRSKSNKPLIRRPGRAPSWSWASVDGELRYLILSNLDPGKFDLAPDADFVAFRCKCGDKKSDASHFTCIDCVVLLHAIKGEGLMSGFPEKTKRFGQFCVKDPNKVETLHWRSLARDYMVGWGLFDEFPVPDEFSYLRISSVSEKQKIVGYCLLLVLPIEGRSNRYRRVGMGYVFRSRMFEGIEKQHVAIV